MAVRKTSLRAPFLKRVWTDMDRLAERTGYPFDLPLVRKGVVDLLFEKPVTIIIGENGTGKSTVLEAIAQGAGFGTAGGTAHHQAAEDDTDENRRRAYADWDGPTQDALARRLERSRMDLPLTDVLRFSWLPKTSNGFFFRAETFHRLARFLDEVGNQPGATPPEHLKMSHAEGFIDFFTGRFERAAHSGRPTIFIFDEPESALAPKRQIEFMTMIRALEKVGTIQFIIATHSPLLMTYPKADLLRLTRGSIEPCTPRQTEHFQFLKAFFDDPDGFISGYLDG